MRLYARSTVHNMPRILRSFTHIAPCAQPFQQSKGAAAPDSTAMKDNEDKKDSQRKEAKIKKHDKAGKTKKATHEGVSVSVASYVNFQVSQLNRGMIVASSSWPNRK